MAAKKTTKKKATKSSDKKVAKKTTKKASKKTSSDEDVVVKKTTKKVAKDKPSTLAGEKKVKPVKKKKLTKKQVAEQDEKDELAGKWSKLKSIDHEIKLRKYKMNDEYAPNTPIEHPKFGWGFVLSINNDRLEVLFETGIRMLVSNYKG